MAFAELCRGYPLSLSVMASGALSLGSTEV